MQATQNLKFKVKEFEWFEMETKVRQIIQEVLGPMQKRILESSNTLHKVKINQAEDEDKINQITLMIANDPKVFETGIFLTVDHKFEQQSKHMQQLSRQIQQSNKYVEEKFKILDIRMEESSQVLKNVASLRERISKEIQLQNDNINQLRTNIEKMIDNLNIDIRESKKAQQSNLEACEKEDYLINQKVREIKTNIENIDAILVNHRDMHREKNLKLESHTEDLKRNQEEIDNLQESKNLTKKLQQFVKHMDNELSRAQFKIDNIIPLITQAQISDCLYTVLPVKMRKKISIHQYKKYYKYNRQVLQKNYKQIRQKFEGSALLQEMQKRNTKEIVQLKRNKLLSMGIDIDHLTYQQRQRYYNQMDLDQAIEDDDQVKIHNKVDQKQIFTIIDKFFMNFTEEVSEKVQIQLEHSKRYLFGVQEEIKHQLSMYSAKYQLTKKQCETFHTEQILQNKAMEHQNKKVQALFEENKLQILHTKELQRLFYNFCSLVNHLQIQDQIDKQNISLMGVQEHNPDVLQNHNSNSKLKQRNSIIELEKKCFSCCGYPASTLSAFKMACLTYNPSSIRIDQKEYRRQQLLEFTTNMLHNIKSVIQTQLGEKDSVKEQQGSIESYNSKGNVYNSYNNNNNNNSNNNSINQNSNIFDRKSPARTLDYQQYTLAQNKSLEATHEQSKAMRVDTEQLEHERRNNQTNNKFRKTKKYISGNPSLLNQNNSHSNSTSKYQTRTRIKSNNAINAEMLNMTAAFTELKKKNLMFIN